MILEIITVADNRCTRPIIGLRVLYTRNYSAHNWNIKTDFASCTLIRDSYLFEMVQRRRCGTGPGHRYSGKGKVGPVIGDLRYMEDPVAGGSNKEKHIRMQREPLKDR